MDTQLVLGIVLVAIVISMCYDCTVGLAFAALSACFLMQDTAPASQALTDDATDNVLPLVSKFASTPFVKKIMEDCKTDKTERGFYAAVPKNKQKSHILATEDTTLETSECNITSMASFPYKHKNYILIHIHTHPDECYKDLEVRPKYPALPSITDIEYDLTYQLDGVPKGEENDVQYVNMIISSNSVIIYQYTQDFIKQFRNRDDGALIMQGENWSDFINKYIEDVYEAAIEKPEKARTVLSGTYPELGITAPVAYCQFYEISEIPQEDPKYFSVKPIAWEYPSLMGFLKEAHITLSN